MADHIKLFTKIYETCEWGNNKNESYRGTSGGGSDVSYNIDTYVPFLKDFIKNNKIESVIDLGCGDFRCGNHIYKNLDINYHGYDAYLGVVENNKNTHPQYNFTHLDFYNKKENIISGDLCILKDVIQHWELSEIYNFLDYLVESKKFKYIILCNCCNQRKDDPENVGRSMPLSANYLPLKKYNPSILYNYNTKEVSLIKC